MSYSFTYTPLSQLKNTPGVINKLANNIVLPNALWIYDFLFGCRKSLSNRIYKNVIKCILFCLLWLPNFRYWGHCLFTMFIAIVHLMHTLNAMILFRFPISDEVSTVSTRLQTLTWAQRWAVDYNIKYCMVQ